MSTKDVKSDAIIYVSPYLLRPRRRCARGTRDTGVDNARRAGGEGGVEPNPFDGKGAALRISKHGRHQEGEARRQPRLDPS